MKRMTDPELQALLKSMTPQQKMEFLEELEEQQRRLQLRTGQRRHDCRLPKRSTQGLKKAHTTGNCQKYLLT
jgi:hypothetical protein